MAKTTIEWTDISINFWMGCTKVSPGCKYCYMYRDKHRYGQDPTQLVKVKPSTIRKALKDIPPSRIFVSSWTDFFIPEADQWRQEAWDIIRAHPQHTWQILTKRPEPIRDRLPADWGNG